jgi:acyl-CoA synthetase (AMP-forming)/AMP-acid ligase II
MDLIQRGTDFFDTIQAGVRCAVDVPKILPTGRCSPGVLLRQWARKQPNKLAIAFEAERYSWRDVNDRANQYGAWFIDRGIGRGDVVALIMDNRPDFLFIVSALSKIGGVASLINTNLTGTALTHGIAICKPKLILSGSEHVEKVVEVLGDLPDIDPKTDVCVQLESGASPPADFEIVNDVVDAASRAEQGLDYLPTGRDVYCYIYTSGTTGLPKAAIISNQRMIAANVTFGHLMHRSGPGDVIYVVLPLYHSSAMFLGWGAALATGAGIALRRKFSASGFWKDVREFRATSFLYIGELCRYLLNAEPKEGERDHQLRVGVGNGMAPSIWRQFQERFGIPTIREFYGATEGNAPIVNLSGKPGMVGRLGIGQALLRCDSATGELHRNADGFCESVKPGEAGLLVARIIPAVNFDGYLDREATNKKIIQDVFKRGDRYFNSGDLLQLHAHRWMSFADRVGDTFRWKGENVSTAEVSGILGAAEGVLEANVYGVRVPNADGRAGMAALQVEDGFDLDDFARFVVERLPGYQRPRFLRLLRDEMRVTGTFKHQKVDYRDEGFDPTVISDPLYQWVDEHYVPVDAARFERIESGAEAVA